MLKCICFSRGGIKGTHIAARTTAAHCLSAICDSVGGKTASAKLEQVKVLGANVMEIRFNFA